MSYQVVVTSVSILVQDLFTITLGWIIFGGLPFDLVSNNIFSSSFSILIMASNTFISLLNKHLTECLNGFYLQLNVIGQLLGFLGSGLYAYYKLIGK